jgi:hypothetical protein
MSPNNIPVRISPIPPRRRSRRALMVEEPASSGVLVEEAFVNV